MSTMRKVTLSTEDLELKTPFRITGHVFTAIQTLHVVITENRATGCGEAVGVYYLNETGDGLLLQAESVRQALERGANREELRTLLPAGGARNAIDCALWDLEAKLAQKSIWELTGIEPGHTRCFYTVGIDTPAEMAVKAFALDSSNIKVKLDGKQPLEQISAVRAARPDAKIVVDVNQGWHFDKLVELAPRLADLGIDMIEQPLPRGADEKLETFDSPIPLCADESCLDTSEFEQAARRYQMINIKLDKTGGLTEALDLAGMARSRGIGLMVGNMVGTSLAMAPGFVVAQLCRYVDLDGPLYLKKDCAHPMAYEHGVLSPPDRALWG